MQRYFLIQGLRNVRNVRLLCCHSTVSKITFSKMHSISCRKSFSWWLSFTFTCYKHTSLLRLVLCYFHVNGNSPSSDSQTGEGRKNLHQIPRSGHDGVMWLLCFLMSPSGAKTLQLAILQLAIAWTAWFQREFKAQEYHYVALALAFISDAKLFFLIPYWDHLSDK